MDKIVERLNRKHNQIQHDIKRLSNLLKGITGEIDRLSEDIEEYAQERKRKNGG